MSRTRRAAQSRLAIALALGTGLAACGAPEADEAKETAEEFVVALSADDSQRLCELWTQDARDQYFSLFGAFDRVQEGCAVADGIPSGTSTDPDAIVSEVETTDDYAAFEVEGLEGQLDLVVVDGEWRVNSICVADECVTAPAEVTPKAPIGG